MGHEESQSDSFYDVVTLLNRWEKDLRRGLLQLMILMFIRLRTPEAHGYGLIKLIQDTGIKTIKAGTIYPLLGRMEKDGLISANLAYDPDTGSSRNMYTVTSFGDQIIDQMMQIYGSYDAIIESLYYEIEKNHTSKR
ncbi:PadR family transcriptional regulator [Candidatus Hodarchaeum mangrovi]